MSWNLWPDDAIELEPSQVVELYERGFCGAVKDWTATEEFQSLYGDQAAAAMAELHGSGAGKLSLPFLAATKLYPDCFPGPAQTTGDCVSHGTKNACLVTMCAEIEAGQPDPDTGVVEGAPEVPEPSQGVIATEPIYGDRGHGGQGASCARLAKFVVDTGGLILRLNYPEAGVDLTRYNSRTGAGWGRGGTPEAVRAIGRKHKVKTAAPIDTAEQVRDMLANGYGVNTCSSLGFSSTRNEDGFSEQRGSWAHSQAVIGYDDRPETVQKYGEALALWLNSWGRWNSGPRRIRATDVDIPEGAYWARSSLFRRCDLYAFSSVNGWPRRQSPWVLI